MGWFSRTARFPICLDTLHLFDVSRFFPVITIVGQGGVTRQRPSIDGFGRFLIVGYTGGNHVADEKIRIIAGVILENVEGSGHMGKGTVRENHPTADFRGQLNHLPT